MGENMSGKTTKKLFKKYPGDAGLDITASQDRLVPAKGSCVVPTGTRISVPYGNVGMLKSRSGLSVNHKLEVGAGVIDNGYTGEVLVHLYNHSDEDYYIKSGDKIAQLLTIPVNLAYYDVVDSLEESERGEKGFGSTGK